MSDSHNTGHGGGHEIDEPPTKELFNIIWGLGALTLLSLVTCVQLFNNQQRDLMAERGKDASFVLEQYSKEMDAVTKGSGELSFKDSNGKEVKQRFVPLAVARELVLSKPNGLHAGAPPPGWQHPDDIAAGGQAAGAVPTPAPTPVPTPTDGVVPAPTDPNAPVPTDPNAPVPAGGAAVAVDPAAPAVPGPPGNAAPPSTGAEPAKPSQPGQPGQPVVAPADAKPATGTPATDPHAGHAGH
jgi:hypothetical protein